MLFKNPLPLPREAFFISKFHKLLYSLFSTFGALLLSLFLSRSHFFSQMAPKRSREVTADVSPARPRSKPRVSQLPSTAAAPELFTSEGNFRRYSELFHGRDLVAGIRFNLSTLTATGLLFEEKLIQCGLQSLAIMEHDVFPEWVW